MKKHVLVQFVLLLAACAGASYSTPEITKEHQKRNMVLRIHPVADLTLGLTDFIPPQITQVGVDEDSETPLFGGVTSGHSYVQDFDVEVAQASAIREPGAFFGRKRTPAETKTWRRSRLAQHATQLLVGDNEKLPLKAARANVRIEGFRARVTLDLFYLNDRDRRLEGNFKVRLPDGASPHRLAFGDLGVAKYAPESSASWKAPKEAYMVPREKASRAYHNTVRMRVDPALMEWSGAGVFSTRVFPLLPGKLHRITVSYDVDVGTEYHLDMPKEAERVEVDITVDGKPHTSAGDKHHVAVDLAGRGNVYLHGSDRSGDYFAARFVPALPKRKTHVSRRGIFLIDVSISSRLEPWLDLVEAILARNRAELREFSVGFFSTDTLWWRDGPSENTAENVAAMRAFADTIAIEGATDIDQALRRADRREGDVFLLTDGHATWGETDLVSGKRVFAYTTGRAPRALLKLTRGATFSVARAGEIGRVATAHTLVPHPLTSISVRGGRDLLLAGSPQAIYPGQTLTLVGRGKPEGPVVFDLDGMKVEVEFGPALESEFAPTVYGHVAVARLEEAHSDLAQSFAMHFRVVGRTCSLLMLDSKNDYKRFGIGTTDRSTVVRDTVVTAVSRKDHLGFLEALDDGLRALVARLPARALRVAAPRLTRNMRTSGLARKDLVYDAIVVEANRRHKQGHPGDALRVLSTLVEQSPGDTALLRSVAYRAMEWGMDAHAYHVLRRIADREPREPHAYRAMAACLDELGKHDLALFCHELAARFGDKRIAGYEYRSFLRRAKFSPALSGHARKQARRLKELGTADLIVVIDWNTRRTDVDLHVVDPHKERCYYQHRQTRAGGWMTNDITTGFGPEMFVLRNAPRGEYRVQAHYYAADSLRASGRTKVLATIYRDWGTNRERVIRKAVTLRRGKEMHELARLRR